MRARLPRDGEATRALRRVRAAAAAALVLVAPAACGGGDDGRVEADELPRVVLQPADLPQRYEQFDDGKVIQTEGPRGKGGWRARYRIPRATAATRGPVVIESRVDLYDSGSAAREGLRPYRDEFAQAARSAADAAQPEVGGLADSAVALALRTPGTPTDVRVFAVAWHEANVAAVVRVNGFEGKLSLDDAVALARKQRARIARAARD